MDMNDFRPQSSHVAQQSRRDKLRIQQHLEDLSEHSNLEQSSSVNVRNGTSFYDSSATLVSSPELINFSANSSVLTAQREAMGHQDLSASIHQHDQHSNTSRPIMTGGDLFTILPHTSVASSHHFRATGDHFQSCGDLKGLDHSQSISEWVVNYASGSSGRESSQNVMLDGEVLSNNNNSTSRKFFRPNNYNEYQDHVHSTSVNQSSEKLFVDMHYATPIFPNTVQDVVTLASVGTHGLEVASLLQQNNARETGHVAWTDHSGNELVLLPSYGGQTSAFRYSDPSNWTNRPEAESFHQWSTESGLRNVSSDAATQRLSLSLSSNPPSDEMHVSHFSGEYESQNLHLKTDSRSGNSSLLGSFPKPSIIRKGSGKSVQDVGTSSYNVHRNTGPLGPFTGYATILKNSRFLKPAQELLDEFCCVKKSKYGKRGNISERFSGDRASASASAEAAGEVGAMGKNSTSCVSSPAIYGSKQICCEGVGNSSSESHRPEYQEMRAKLLYLQEEVSKRYKLYHQQLQMVVSSFESVAGLSGATPYVSLAFKAISKNFRCLKSAIMNQLKHVAKALGEEMRSSATGTSASKGHITNTSVKLNCLDQILQKHKSGGANVGFLEPQQHVWRPQRGLPERAVAILRAWLFEHFLHPYPTDTDKHMLATQTGLSRNQVSNWFINARVRVWKPMVEEIHMLETQGSVATNQNFKTKTDGQSLSDGTAGSSFDGDQLMNDKLAISAMSDEHVDYSGIGSSRSNNEEGLNAEPWNQEKRSRVDSNHQLTTSMDRSLMGFIPYQRNVIEVGGLSAVSLTLGLRHEVESSPQQQQEDRLRRQYGGQMIHDFAG